MTTDCSVIWVGNDGAVDLHERLHFVPGGEPVGEVMLILPEGEILQMDGAGEEYTIDPEGSPPELVAMQVARDYRACLTITAPVGFGLDRAAPNIERVMKNYRWVKTQEFAGQISSAPENDRKLLRGFGLCA
jgi:hypothetical protein